MNKRETFFFGERIVFSEDFLAKIFKILGFQLRHIVGESNPVQLPYHTLLHLRTGIVGESNRQNLLVARTGQARVVLPVAQECGQVVFETGGDIVKHQVVGFPGACGGGIDREHGKVKGFEG